LPAMDAPPPARSAKPPALDPRREVRVCGLNACRALLQRRPDDAVRIYLVEGLVPEFGPALAGCAKARKAYHIVTTESLDRVSESTHHEGICIVARRKPPGSAADVLGLMRRHPRGPLVLVLLENVGNPHNLGAIVRVCAHFGVPALLAAGAEAGKAPFPPAVYRTAEGGMESVDVVPVSDAVAAVRGLRGRGLAIVATSSHAKATVYESALPARCLLLFGSEAEGLSAPLLRLADTTVAIPGTGAVGSLNVACAAAVLLAEFRRCHPHLRPPRAGRPARA